MYVYDVPFRVSVWRGPAAAVAVHTATACTIVGVRLDDGCTAQVALSRFGRWLGLARADADPWTKDVSGVVRVMSRSAPQWDEQRAVEVSAPSAAVHPMAGSLHALMMDSITCGVMPREERGGAEFFYRLDLYSNTALASWTPPAQQPPRGFTAAQVRLQNRIERRIQGLPVTPDPEDAAMFEPVLRNMAGGLRATGVGGDDALIAERVLRAFVRFGSGAWVVLHGEDSTGNAAGPARSAVSNGGPNGSLVFCFAELALLAAEVATSAADRALWERLRAAMVAGAECYLLHYQDLEGDGRVQRAGYGSAVHAGCSVPRRHRPAREVIALEARYRGMSAAEAEARLNRILQTAFTPTGKRELTLNGVRNVTTASAGFGFARFPMVMTDSVPAQAWDA